MNTDGLPEIADSVRAYLDSKHRAREQALPLTREVVRLSANAIRNVHRGNFDVADELLAKAKANLEQTESGLQDHRDIFYAGFVHDAQKEFAEANTTLAFIAGRPLPLNGPPPARRRQDGRRSQEAAIRRAFFRSTPLPAQ